jgi:hypothetical protein
MLMRQNASHTYQPHGPPITRHNTRAQRGALGYVAQSRRNTVIDGLTSHLLLGTDGSPSLLHLRTCGASTIIQGSHNSRTPPCACERPAVTTSEASAAACETAMTPQVAVTEQGTPGVETSVFQMAL